jgi:hypothetical protein
VSGARLSTLWLQLLLGLALLGVAAAVDGAARRQAAARRGEVEEAYVRRLDLTDPCLFTEARYTRHLSQADAFSAFQDHPRSLEHFPSGSIVPRPPEPSPR